MNDQALTTRGDAISVEYDTVTEALAMLGVDVGQPDLIASVHVDGLGVTVERFREDDNGLIVTDATFIAIKRGHETGESA